MNIKLFFKVLLLFPLVSYGCNGGENEDTPDKPTIDTSTGCKTAQTDVSFATFYKPKNGSIGDPMPFYDEDSKTVKMFFLFEDHVSGRRNSIYYLNTTDFGSYSNFTETFAPGGDSEQDKWIGTGSFVKKNGTYYCFYTGHNETMNPIEKVMLATSTNLKDWTKVSSLLIEAPDGNYKNDFRDPAVYFDETRNTYVMLVTSVRGGDPVIDRYSSNDLLNWTQIESMTDFDTDSDIMECPDIFKMGNKWYLVFSRINRDNQRKVYYRISDTPNGPWKICEDAEGKHDTFDGLWLYAAKTVAVGNDRYLAGWCSIGQTVESSNELKWGGNLTTHKLVQQPSGKLYTTIPEGLDNKFSSQVDYAKISSQGNVSGDTGAYTITAGSERAYALFNRNSSAAIKISMKIDASQSNSFGFLFGGCGDMSDIYTIKFDLTSNNTWGTPAMFMHNEVTNPSGTVYKNELNYNRLIVPNNKIFDVKIIIERSIATVYINGNVAFTNRIYKMELNPWGIFSDNGSINISNLKINKIP